MFLDWCRIRSTTWNRRDSASNSRSVLLSISVNLPVYNVTRDVDLCRNWNARKRRLSVNEAPRRPSHDRVSSIPCRKQRVINGCTRVQPSLTITVANWGLCPSNWPSTTRGQRDKRHSIKHESIKPIAAAPQSLAKRSAPHSTRLWLCACCCHVMDALSNQLPALRGSYQVCSIAADNGRYEKYCCSINKYKNN